MSGPIIVPGDDAPEGVLLPLYRRATGKKIGPYVTYLTTGEATGAEAARQVVIARATDDEMGFEALSGQHLYVATGDQAEHQTRVLSVGTHGPDGILRMARMAAGVVGEGIEIELSASAPAVSYGMWPCLNDAVNEALSSLPIHKDHDFVYVAQQMRYDLSALTWRTFRREDVLDVYPPIPSGYTAAQIVARPISRGSWSVEYDGELPYLQLHGWGCNPGQTFFVKMRRPASTWINNGGTWGSSNVGLTNDSQAALYDVDAVVNVAAPIVCERLEGYWLDQGDNERAARWARKADELGGASVMARFARSFRGSGAMKVGPTGAR